MDGEAMVPVATLAAVFVAARLLGAAARRLRQPSIVGEILAGVLLGPTLLGLRASPTTDLVGKLSVGLFLLAAGMQVDLAVVARERRTAMAVAVGGLVVPFAIGCAVAWRAPEALGFDDATDRTAAAVFFGVAMAISALPVIARTLMNLGLYRTDFGMTVMAAAVIDDVVGWTLFALLVARFGTSHAHAGVDPAWAFVLVPAFAALMLTVVRRGADAALRRVAPRVGAGGVVALAAVFALGAGLAARWTGVHAVFGAFLAGVALGGSAHVPERSKEIVGRAVDDVFAPLFFGTVGLALDVGAGFDWALCALVLALACATKLAGCSLAARLIGMPPRRAWAFGFAMNSRGAMEIVVGLLALEAGLIGQRLLVALVLMALVTSLVGGPAIARLMKPPS